MIPKRKSRLPSPQLLSRKLVCSIISSFIVLPKVKSRVPQLLSQLPSQGEVPTLTVLQKKVPDLTSCLVEVTFLEGNWNCIIPHLVESSFPLNERQVTIKSSSQNNPVASLQSECLTSTTEEADVPLLKGKGRVALHFTPSTFTQLLNRSSCQTHRSLKI